MPTDIAAILQRYAEYVTATDVDGILALYAPTETATAQIPVGGPVQTGIDAIRRFYAENELAESLEITGPVCAAGNEAAVQMRARVRRNGQLTEVDVIDVVKVDDAGRITSLRAFFDLGGIRGLDG